MKYLRIVWKHKYPDEPILMYHELDANRWEIRKVEVFRSGRIGYASAAGESGGTGLGTMPVPELNEIVSDPVFEGAEITRDEFEEVWSRRLHPELLAATRSRRRDKGKQP